MKVSGVSETLRRRQHNENGSRDGYEHVSKLSNRGKGFFAQPRYIIIAGLVVLTATILLLYSVLPRRGNIESDDEVVDRSESSLRNLPESDDEDALHAIDLKAVHPATETSDIAKGMIGCMPSVRRKSGEVEYVSNAVKSWGLATEGGTKVGRLVVFDMDVEGDSVEKNLGGMQGAWWEVRKRERYVKSPRMRTHGDSVERVQWRSKEALDYAEVLERCVEEASASGVEYVLIVQDDVLFRPEFIGVGGQVGKIDEQKDGKTCAVSLFDIGSVKDGQKQNTSNMVAKVIKLKRARGMARYIRSKYDQSPVDWLADEYCRNWGLQTLVIVPNVVRHRGKVSSFSGNEREGLLT